MLDLINTRINQDYVLFNLYLLLYQLNNLLFKELLLIDIHLLKLPKISVNVHDIFHYLFESVICGLHSLVLEGSQLRPDQLHLPLILV